MNRLNRFIGLSILLVLIATGCASSGGNVNETEIEESSSVPVTIAIAQKGTLFEKILTLGDIEASAVHKILSGRGTVEEIYVKAGDLVEGDQILFKLDVGNLQNSYNTTESQLRTVRDNLRIQKNDQEAFYNKQVELYAAGAISKADLDRAKLSFSQIDKQYRDSTITYSNQISNLKDGLADREIKSPISGKVASVNIIENQMVSDSMAIEVIDDSSMIVNTKVTADQINKMNHGDQATVYPDGDRRKKVTGTITVLNEVPDSSTGLYNVELQLEDTDYMLRTGEFAEIETFIDQRTAIVVPKKSIKKIGEKEYVFVAKDTVAIEREVVTGAIQGELIEIVSGVASGEKVVVRGLTFLKDQTKIEIAE